MALPLSGRDALGAAGELVKTILNVKDKADSFRDDLQSIESTLTLLKPQIVDFMGFDVELSDGKSMDMRKLIHLLQECEETVRKVANAASWDLTTIYLHSKKLRRLDDSLRRFYQMDVQSQILRGIRQICYFHTKEATGRSDRLNRLAIAGGESDLSFDVPPVPSLIVGLDLALQELKMKLFGEDEHVLGICGMLGIGKTTLAAMLCSDEEVKGKFAAILFITISSSLDLEVIVQRLWMKISSLLQTGEALELQPGNMLTNRERESILVVCDDVCSLSILRFLLAATVGCKVLITSRTAFRFFDYTYTVDALSDRDAESLFYSYVSPQELCSADNDQVKQIINRCGGHPLALKELGDALHQQLQGMRPSSEKMLFEERLIMDCVRDLLHRFECSLDGLGELVRKCFMDLGVFPEGARIPTAALKDMWLELYSLHEEDAREILRELSSKSLLKLFKKTRHDDDEEIHYHRSKEPFVIQHRLWRELAIHCSHCSDLKHAERLNIDQREERPWKEHEGQVFFARILSLQTGEMDRSSWYDMQFPQAEVMILKFCAQNDYCLPPFIERMDKLKFLFIANCGPSRAKIRGLDTLSSLLNLTRIRMENVSISSHDEFRQMKSLQKLSLLRCEIGQTPILDSTPEVMPNLIDINISQPDLMELPGGLCDPSNKLSLLRCEIGQIPIPDSTPEVIPNLTDIDISQSDLMELPGGLCDPSHIQRLSLTDSHAIVRLPKSIDGLINLRRLNLHGCRALAELPDSICILKSLALLDISYCLRLESLPPQIGSLWSLRRLHMRGCSSLRQLPTSTRELTNLISVSLDVSMANLWEPFREYLPGLDFRMLQDSDSDDDDDVEWIRDDTIADAVQDSVLEEDGISGDTMPDAVRISMLEAEVSSLLEKNRELQNKLEMLQSEVDYKKQGAEASCAAEAINKENMVALDMLNIMQG